ncbi:tripartite tricarboxylate transporter substrate binding protein [Kroppenstedtia eburnea]|uniref:Tripartite-type tricarboxylate transporter, receptor component TctC n=1 Tax=Kroppenstedtia eburnea TaxID=714067 RepID=A0A1N7LH91_9BACL|nr:tripartite tricarboxylate transporter substrate binding protein [Kroppenstedtia eburnea]SIS73174.1 Tripartite-type tricarboxylate transporter, receptor component TctC [Kroppenstedtia eburnea]
MKRSFWKRMALLLTGALLLTACEASLSADRADFPERQITYMIPFEAGGQSDVEARRQHPLLEKELGQPVVITYKPGGGGSVGWTELVRQQADGYYLAGINVPHIILQPLANPDTGYQTEQIQPVVLFQRTPIGLAVPKESEIKSIEDLVQKAKKNPGKLTVAGSGTYSGHHLAFRQLEKFAGIRMKYVPFTGATTQVQAFLGGNTDVILANSSDLVKYKEQLQILAIGSDQRTELFPDAPTFKEAGYEMSPVIDRGVGVPAGTPAPVVRRLEEVFLRIARNDKIKEQMIKDGFEPLEMGAAETEKYIQRKTVELTPVIEEMK